MDQFTNHFDVSTDDSSSQRTAARGLMNPLMDVLIKLGILKEDLDYHVPRAAMVIIFFFFVSEMVGVRGAAAASLYQQRPPDFLVVSGFWCPRSQ
jgi:hypothetical protein